MADPRGITIDNPKVRLDYLWYNCYSYRYIEARPIGSFFAAKKTK